jgi:tetratricopeptide (TPR) repeat protein
MNRPRRDFFSIQTRMSGLAAITGVSDTSALRDVIEQLSRDCGLTIYAGLDPSLEPSARLTQALTLAQQRYEETPEEHRLFDPLTSIRHLARAVVEACGFLVTSYDYKLWKSLPSLQPLQALSPALTVIATLVQGVGNRIAARIEKSCQAYRELLDRIAQPDGAGLEETYRENIRTAVIRAMGMLEASMGLDSALALASELEKNPAFELNAMQIRILYYLWQGDTERAEKVKRDLELLKIQKNPTQLFEGANLARELSAYALADDFTGVKLMLNPVKQMADKYRDWRATYLYAKGEYHRLRGDLSSALGEFEKALRIAVVGAHQSWADITGAYLKTLVELGRFEEAKALGTEALQTADQADLGYVRSYLRMPLAVAEARLKNHEAAVRHAQNAIDEIRQTGCTGINLGLAYEARAIVAIAMKNREDYQSFSDKCAEQFCNRKNVALLAKYEKLTAEAHHPETGVFSDLDTTAGQAELSGQPANQMVSNAIASCNSADERYRRILELLIEHSGTAKGFLYLMQDDGPRFVAQIGNAQPPKGLEDTVRTYLKAELDHSENVTVTGVEPDSTIGTATCWTGYGGEEYRPLLLGHHTKEGYLITGIAVLLLDPTRKFRFPIGLIVAISKHLREQEEVVSLMATYQE